MSHVTDGTQRTLRRNIFLRDPGSEPSGPVGRNKYSSTAFGRFTNKLEMNGVCTFGMVKPEISRVISLSTDCHATTDALAAGVFVLYLSDVMCYHRIVRNTEDYLFVLTHEVHELFVSTKLQEFSWSRHRVDRYINIFQTRLYRHLGG
jgi:hypothetical protein